MLWWDRSPHAYNSGSYSFEAPGDRVHQTILVLDFGSQFTQLIARRLRELSVYSEILPFNTPVDVIRAKHPVGLILSGGPKSVSESDAPKCDPDVLSLGLPTLGICYGMQLMTDMLGGRVAPSPIVSSGLRPSP
jgi:GMP synthase (glutamine-hydrolysing)